MQPTRRKKEITKEMVQAALPSRKNTITDEIVDLINQSQNDPEFQGESLLQTATTYEQVLVRNKASIRQYLDAIRFCAYLLSEDDNATEAYKRTFIDRDFVQERINQPTDSNKYIELVSAASRYRRSKLVVDILTVSQVPMELIFNGLRHKAVGVLADRMMNSKLDRDRISAAKELLAATKGPDEHRIELDVGVKQTDIITSLNEQLAAMAETQMKMLQQGKSISEVQKIGISVDVIDAEVTYNE